jgi:uncharacterized protein YpmB
MMNKKVLRALVLVLFVSVFALGSASVTLASDEVTLKGELKKVDGKVILDTEQEQYVIEGRDLSYYVGMDFKITGTVTENDGKKHIKMKKCIAIQ